MLAFWHRAYWSEPVSTAVVGAVVGVPRCLRSSAVRRWRGIPDYFDPPLFTRPHMSAKARQHFSFRNDAATLLVLVGLAGTTVPVDGIR